jgi:hypothetical protein
VVLGVGVSTAADYGISIDEFNADDYGPKALAWCKADIETERRRCKSKADMIRISENARLGQSIDQDGGFPRLEEFSVEHLLIRARNPDHRSPERNKSWMQPLCCRALRGDIP